MGETWKNLPAVYGAVHPPAAAGTVICISGAAMVAIGAFLLAEQLVH
ncbi:hypothetical protein [Paenarthrobacter sp. PH39-S1]|nr:hypothetical protein [Paenarthrobacter sp. PH39-S1]MDJ0355599.1 hypothetical protein [Paenarthrobacter sp. PH39-S1]